MSHSAQSEASLPGGRPKRLLAITAVAVLAAAVALLPQVVSVPDGAEAATPVHADPLGACDGEANCFTTIQEAVNNAGPAPAEVRIFPGIYTESVDLSLMGSAIAGAAGDITLIAVDASNVPTDVGMQIDPGTGPAIWHSASPFPGSVVIRGITATSPDATAIIIVTGADAIELHEAALLSAGVRGADLRSTSGPVSIAASLSNSNADDGFLVETAGDIVVSDSIATNSLSADGFDLESFGGTMTITDSIATGNAGGDGFELRSEGDVVISDIVANNNGQDGVNFRSNAPLSITITNALMNQNTDDGLDIDDRGFAITVVITNSEASLNSDEGLEVDTLTSGSSLVITGTIINGNGDQGIDGAGAVPVTVTCSIITNNVNRGINFAPRESAAMGTINYNNISGNGIGVRNNSGGTVDARHNWWGAVDGPGPVGPGSGDTISTDVNFTPFLTEPVNLQECPPEVEDTPTPTATVPGEETATPPPAVTATPTATPDDVDDPTATPAPVEPEPTPTSVDADLGPTITAPVAGSGPLGGMSASGMLALAAGIAGLAAAAAGVSLRSRLRRLRA